MFDVGWQELFVIAAVGIVVIGPKDLPRALAQMTKYMRKARSIAREFQSSIDEVVRQAELDDIRKEVEKASSLNLENEIRNTIDPTGEVARDLDLSGVQSDLEKATASVTGEGEAPAGPPVAPETPIQAPEPERPSAGADGAPKGTRSDDPANPASG
jgi:sec-independent protein translocase protein TatB